MTTSTHDLVRAFTTAAAALAERMASDLQARDADLATKVAACVEHGHRLKLALITGDAPTIELSTVDDYMHSRIVASIQALSGPQH